MQIDGETARKIIDGKHRHTMTASDLRLLPEGLYNPLMVFDSPDTRTGASGKLMVTEAVDRLGNPIVALVHISKRSGRLVINDVASAYGLEDFGARNKTAPEKLEYVRNKKDLAASTTPNLRMLAGVVQKARGLISTVATESNVVNQFGIRYSVILIGDMG